MDRLLGPVQGNIDAVFNDDNIAGIKEATTLLLQARRIHCIGVRSCFSLAHYFSDTWGMAFPNFERTLTEPGIIADRLAHAGPEEVIVLITFSLSLSLSLSILPKWSGRMRLTRPARPAPEGKTRSHRVSRATTALRNYKFPLAVSARPGLWRRHNCERGCCSPCCFGRLARKPP